jgi:hypothetical protein
MSQDVEWVLKGDTVHAKVDRGRYGKGANSPKSHKESSLAKTAIPMSLGSLQQKLVILFVVSHTHEL